MKLVHQELAGRTQVDSQGVVRDSFIKSDKGNVMFNRRPAAIKWTTALVEPPSAHQQSNRVVKTQPPVKMCGSQIFADQISTIRRPVASSVPAAANQSPADSVHAPGSIMPKATDNDVIVEAVPIVLRAPAPEIWMLPRSFQS